MLKNILVFVLLVGFVFNSYWPLLYIQKAKAQAPAPAPAGWAFQFPDDSRGTVKVSATVNNAVQEFEFTGRREIQKSDVPGYSDASFNSAEKYYVYKITGLKDSNGVSHPIKCNALDTLGEYYVDLDFYLLVTQTGETYWQHGLTADRASLGIGNALYERFSNGNNVQRTCSGSRFNNSHAMVQFADNVNTRNSTLIRRTATIDNVAEYCTQLRGNWQNLKTSFRGLVQPVPQSNANWENNSDYGSTRALGFQVLGAPLLLLAGGGAALFGVSREEFDEGVADQLFSTTIDYNLTETGQNAYASVVSKATEMRTQIDALIEQFGADTWPSECGDKLIKFKWNESLEDPSRNPPRYETLGEFKAALDKAFETFQKFAAAYDAPVSSNSDSCGSPGMKGVGILAWMLCALGSLTHMIAQAMMTTAVKYLEMSVGVNINFAPLENIQKDEPAAGETPTPAPTPNPNPSETFAFDKNLTFTPGELCNADDISAIRSSNVADLRVQLVHPPNDTTLEGAARTVTASGSGFTARIVSRTAVPAGRSYTVIIQKPANSVSCIQGFNN